MDKNFVTTCKSFSGLLHSKIRSQENIEVCNKKMLYALAEIEKMRKFVKLGIQNLGAKNSAVKNTSDILADMINLYNTAKEHNINE